MDQVLLIVHACAPCLETSAKSENEAAEGDQSGHFVMASLPVFSAEPLSQYVCTCMLASRVFQLSPVFLHFCSVCLSVWLCLPVRLFVCSAVPIGTLSAFHISFPSHHRASIDVPLHFDGGSVESPDYKCGCKYTAGKYSSLSCSHREQVVAILSE